MLKIGDFSKLSRCSVRMLRHYDEIGLLEPAEIDRFTGYRYYSEAQLTVIGQIISLRDMGFSLAAIGEMLKLDDPERLDSFYAIRQDVGFLARPCERHRGKAAASGHSPKAAEKGRKHGSLRKYKNSARALRRLRAHDDPPL